MPDIMELITRTTVLQFSYDQCVLMMFLLDVEALDAVGDVLMLEASNEEKRERLINGLGQHFFIRSLLQLQAQNPSIFLTFNGLATEYMATLLREVDGTTLPANLADVYQSNGALMLDKLSDIETQQTANVSKDLS